MTSRFQSFLDGQILTSNPPLLPIVHTMTVGKLNRLIVERSLSPEACDVFEEDLVYLFYGRPAFRGDMSTGATSIPSLHLCALLLAPINLPFKRAFPFDSGAMHTGMYKHAIREAEMSDFGIEPNYGTARKIVKLFFDGNKNYLLGNATNESFFARNGEADGYRALINSETVSKEDDRRGTIEFQIDSPLNIDASNVLGIVLPNDELRDPVVENFILNELNAKAIPYPRFHDSPANHGVLVLDRALAFYEENGYLA